MRGLPEPAAELAARLRTYLPELKKKYAVRSLGLFGSYIHNRQTPESDVDKQPLFGTGKEKVIEDLNEWMLSMVNSSDPRDVSFAREVLGKTRFELVKSEKLKMESLYYGGRLRTIKELEHNSYS